VPSPVSSFITGPISPGWTLRSPTEPKAQTLMMHKEGTLAYSFLYRCDFANKFAKTKEDKGCGKRSQTHTCMHACMHACMHVCMHAHAAHERSLARSHAHARCRLRVTIYVTNTDQKWFKLEEAKGTHHEHKVQIGKAPAYTLTSAVFELSSSGISPCCLQRCVRTHGRTHARTHDRTHARWHARTHARTHAPTIACMHAQSHDRTIASGTLLGSSD
jgi:hypothetical protein